ACRNFSEQNSILGGAQKQGQMRLGQKTAKAQFCVQSSIELPVRQSENLGIRMPKSPSSPPIHRRCKFADVLSLKSLASASPSASWSACSSSIPKTVSISSESGDLSRYEHVYSPSASGDLAGDPISISATGLLPSSSPLK